MRKCKKTQIQRMSNFNLKLKAIERIFYAQYKNEFKFSILNFIFRKIFLNKMKFFIILIICSLALSLSNKKFYIIFKRINFLIILHKKKRKFKPTAKK